MTVTNADVCNNCGAEFKSKCIIRVDHDWHDPKAKRHFQSPTKGSVVGWIKFIVDNYAFEDITIDNLLSECPDHQDFHKVPRGKPE